MALHISKPVYSFKEAKELLTEAHACLRLTTSVMHIALDPKYLNNVSAGVLEQLNSQLRLHNQQLNGVVVTYSNIQIQQSHGLVITSQPHVHFDIYADFIIFQPTIGGLIKAVVHKLGRGFISCLAHQCFNVSFPFKDNNNEEYMIGDEVVIQVESINKSRDGIISLSGRSTGNNQLKRKRLSLEGEGDQDDSVFVTPTGKPKKKRKISMDNNDDIEAVVSTSSNITADSGVSVSTPNFGDCSDASISHKKRRKSKSKSDNEESDSHNTSLMNDSQVIIEENMDVTSSNKKKKKKKKKKSKHRSDNEESEAHVSSLNTSQSQNDNSISKKHHKKHKHKRESINPDVNCAISDASVDSGIENHTSSSSKRKKKKVPTATLR